MDNSVDEQRDATYVIKFSELRKMLCLTSLFFFIQPWIRAAREIKNGSDFYAIKLEKM